MGKIADKMKQQNEYEKKGQCYSITSATITQYDVVSNTASIKYRNPNGQGNFSKNNVPVNIPQGGLTASGVSSGVTCSIAFQGGNIHTPIIIGISDVEYSSGVFEEKNNSDQGAFLIAGLLENVNTEIEIVPMIQDWIDEKGSYFQLEETGVIDVNKEVQKMLYFLNKYKDTEDGITNINTKATIKTCENGDIRIFINNNTGICLNNKNKTIEIYGDIKIKGKIL